MRKNSIIFLGVVVLLALVVSVGLFLKDKSGTGQSAQTAPTEDPLDVTLDFYNSWLTALQSTTTDPYQSGLANLPVLSLEVQSYIEKKRTEKKEGDPEVVICQPLIPERIGGKAIYAKETEAQIMVLARGLEVKSSHIAVVTLGAKDGAWMINDITCSQGEIGPDKEFDFAYTGFLLKQSVPAPLNPQNWHLVFEQNGQEGYTAPLFFNAESICVAADGSESVCDPSTFREATKVSVQADMTEEGGTVRKMRFE